VEGPELPAPGVHAEPLPGLPDRLTRQIDPYALPAPLPRQQEEPPVPAPDVQ
jgi:hypothetical protein